MASSPEAVLPPPIQRRHLSYVERLENRAEHRIDLAVIHCTELPDLAMARQFGEVIHYPATRTGNAGHFYLARTGAIEEWVPVERVAHHVRGYNHRSIGIELVNRGRYPNWLDSRYQQFQEPYASEQLAALKDLLIWLSAALPSLKWLAGHEQLDPSRVQASDDPGRLVSRKLDPGPLFPWRELLQSVSLEPFERIAVR